MPATTQTTTQENRTRLKLSLEQRSRSVPYKKVFVVAVISALLFYLVLIAFFTSIATIFLAPPELKRGAAFTMAGLLPVTGLFWLISYFKRRKASCPLCKSSPFLDNFAHKHEKSFRVKPFNYGTTAILNVLFTQRWRCMHCGTPFDLLKTKHDLKLTSTKDDKQSTETREKK